jgi:hypothetical protein
MILNSKENRHLGLYIAMSLIFCTLPSVGLALLMFYKILVENGIHKSDFKSWLKDTASWENLIVGVPILIIFGAFVKSNMAGGTISFGIKTEYILQYLVTILFQFFLFFVATYKYQYKNKLFYFSFICLVLSPMVSVNNAADFCMRASIPALLILFLLVVNTFEKAIKKKDRFIIIYLSVLIAIGSITSFNEINRTFKYTGKYPTRLSVLLDPDLVYEPNFYGYTEKSYFYHIIMRK